VQIRSNINGFLNTVLHNTLNLYCTITVKKMLQIIGTPFQKFFRYFMRKLKIPKFIFFNKFWDRKDEHARQILYIKVVYLAPKFSYCHFYRFYRHF